MNEEIKLILEANRLILRDRKWNNGDYKDKAEVINNEISKLLNPKKEQPINGQTKDGLLGLSEVKR